MSLAGIAATSFLSGVLTPRGPNKIQQPEQDLQQLGRDLREKNLPAAQLDFKTLQRDLPAGGGVACQYHHLHLRAQGLQRGQDGIVQILGDLGQALQAGNLSAAQQGYAALLRGIQPESAAGAVSVTA